MRSYGVAETIVRSKVSVTEVVRQSHPDRIDFLIDLAGDATGFRSHGSACPSRWHRHHDSVRRRPPGPAVLRNSGCQLCPPHDERPAALLAEAIELCEEISAPLNLYWAWGALGEARLLEEKYEDAAVCSMKALIGFRRLGLRDLAVSRLIDVACCATHLGEPAEATRLAGAYEGMHSPYLRQAGIPGRSNRFKKLTLIEEKLRAGNCERLRQVLGDDDFSRDYSAGGRLTFDEAVDLALCVPRKTGASQESKDSRWPDTVFDTFLQQRATKGPLCVTTPSLLDFSLCCSCVSRPNSIEYGLLWPIRRQGHGVLPNVRKSPAWPFALVVTVLATDRTAAG